MDNDISGSCICDKCGGGTDTPIHTEDGRLLCPDCHFYEYTMTQGIRKEEGVEDDVTEHDPSTGDLVIFKEEEKDE